ncbi:hypothetical protein TWF730_010151 [Orbilia blumenaviensis]|uniref:Uncharacterized protein n=1 Tax=Orbilia blumenaviensis TaxID=1796055 RepID=A0AAV9UP01_9PEZI
MLGPVIIKTTSRAALLLAIVPPLTLAWFMQLTTTQTISRFQDGQRTTEPAYLYQSSDEPLNFESCVKINWGNLNYNTKINFFSLARDIPGWDYSKTKEENLRDVVRGIVFFEGSNCEALTTRIIFRLDDDYTPGSYLFLTSKPVVPALRLGSWRPMWLYGQGGYSDSLARIEVGKSELFPPPPELSQIVERYQEPPLNTQQQRAPVINLQRVQTDLEPQLQPQPQPQPQRQQGFIPIRPNINTSQRTGNNQGGQNQAGQTLQQGLNSDPREALSFSEILRDNSPGEGGMSPRQSQLRQLTNQVEDLQRRINSMTADRERANVFNNNNPNPNTEIFEEEKQDNVEASQFNNFNLLMSPSHRPGAYSPNQQDPNDINNFFRVNSGNQPDYIYDQNFGALQRSNSGDQYFTGNDANPFFLFSRAGSDAREAVAEDQQGQELEREQASPIMEESVQENLGPESGSNGREVQGGGNSRNQGQIVEEVPVDQARRPEVEPQRKIASDENQPQDNRSQDIQSQVNQPQVMNQPSTGQIEMPPPTRPTRNQSQGNYPFDIATVLENNRLRYAQLVNSKDIPYFETLGRILAGTGKMIQDTLVLMVRDPNVEHTDQYLAEIERLINTRKQLLAQNDDLVLEAVQAAGAQLRGNNAMVLGPQNRNQQAQGGNQQYGSLNGGMKREDV